MKFYVKLNPLLAYLIKRKSIDLIPELTPIFWLWVVSSLVIAGFMFINAGAGVICIFPLCVLIYIPSMFVPVAIGYSAAASTSQSVASQEHELLKLANIPDRTILWSYIVATLYRFRGLLVGVIGLAPLIFVSASFAWAIWETGFGESRCMETPIGTTYCGEIDPPSPSQAERFLIYAKTTLLTLGLAASLSGINILFAALGAILGFWLPNRFVTLTSAGFIAFIGAILIGIVILPEIMLRTLSIQAFDLPTLFAVLIMIFAPYILAFGLVHTTSHLVRRPIS